MQDVAKWAHPILQRLMWGECTAEQRADGIYSRIEALAAVVSQCDEVDWDFGSIDYGVSLADLFDGAYWFCADHHDGQWSDGYAALCRIGEVFTPGAVSNGPESNEAREVYSSLRACI